MRALGIVCEYNPFHFGHLYQMEKSRKIAGDAAVVCVMSGDFVQRGEAALMDKFARAEAACRCGADLVVELPLPWCLSSAEGFARGAVSILNALGCSFLSFGCETERLNELEMLAEKLLDPETRESIQVRIREDAALSYAQARQLTLESSLGDTAALLTQPNSILAVEYLKAIRQLQSSMQPIAIRRQGAGHDEKSDGVFRSASQLRVMFDHGEAIDSFLPAQSAQMLLREKQAGNCRSPEKLELALLSRLYSLAEEVFDRLPDASDGAGRKLYKTLREGYSLEETVQRASTRRYTKSRMRRILLCAALDVKPADSVGIPPYARILAASERGRAYLSENRETIQIPLVTKPASVKKLDARAQELFERGSAAHDLYVLQKSAKERSALGEDWRRGPFIGQFDENTHTPPDEFG